MVTPRMLNVTYLDRSLGNLPDLLNLAAALPNEGAALAGGHHQAEGEPLLARHRPAFPPPGPALLVLHLGAHQAVRLEDGVGGAGDCDHPLGTGAVTDVDLGTGLLPDVVDDLPALPDDRANLLQAGQISTISHWLIKVC